MLKFVILGTIASYATAALHPVNKEIIEDIKNKATTWTPMEHEENPLTSYTPEQIKSLLGTHVRGPIQGYTSPDVMNGMPKSFDSRAQWPDCIHPIRNQEQCGSCWAFAASEAFSDRICITSGGKTNVVISPEDLVSCDHTNMGCNGGYLNNAWTYLTKTGAVSDACFPYSAGKGNVPSCPADACEVSGEEYKKYRCKSGSVVQATNPNQIKSEIMQNGPVETGFTVYSDFMSYKSGVYQHTTGEMEGGHAVKIIGWGEENGTPYWLVANSWGTSWGLEGLFKIKQGDCGIDEAVYACTPDV